MKAHLERNVIAMRIASELVDGEVVNVGFGLVSAVNDFVPPEKDIIYHAENGGVGYGRILTVDDPKEMVNYNWVEASGRFVAPLPGMSAMDVSDAFSIAWVGRLDTSVLGALQVSEQGDLASWSLDPKGAWGSPGGAMDFALLAKRVIIGMDHVNKNGEPKIVKKCSLPLTARECVDLIVTDLAVIEVTREGLVLKEVAPGWTPKEVQELTGPKLIVRNVKEMQLFY